ncbi:hypothetical protein DRE_02906 [Drechslerella stenobrocha 248]|uniref:MARVEL domain-containing protein n=1 Tax=Drechslerella stenobrocha 248 TaxID=1043628 RepID=W7HU50_9PEZI|nr:hypothetical protein DRE_02906 [Drechslerella stenobrocha 248]
MAMSLTKIQVIQKAAYFTHGFQGLMVFILWIVLLALKAQKGGTPSQANVLFAMCFISVPVIIYTAMAPRWPRTVKFSHPIAQTALCFVSTIIFFAGFVSLAVHNNEGISRGETDGVSSCATTIYGTPRICELSKAVIGLGVVVFFAFAVTTGMYAYTCYWLWRENLPFTAHLRPGAVAAHDVEATTQDAFSHKDDHMLDPQEDEHPHPSDVGVPPPASGVGSYALLSGTAVGQGRWQGEDDDDDADFRRDNGYRNEHNASVTSGNHPGRSTPLTGIQDPYTDRVEQPVEFPQGPYNNGYRY